MGGATPGGGAPPRGPGGAGAPAGGGGGAPAISNERRPGLNYGGSVKQANEADLQNDTESGTLTSDEGISEGVRKIEKRDEDTVVRLPRASNRRKYTLLEED
jgi:hypothetical protein